MKYVVSHPQRLDAFLSHHSALSRSEAKRAIQNGAVVVNGQKAKKAAQQLQNGDEVIVNTTAEIRKSPQGKDRRSSNLHLNILYEDDACMVVDKPAGVSVHPGSSSDERDTVLHGIAHLFEERSLPYSSSSVLVHRLDKDTTGCLLIAKNAKAHRALQKQFKDRTISKRYLAVVAGVPDPPSSMIDAPVGRNIFNRLKMSVLGAGATRGPRTTYKTLGVSNGCALLACDLHTGRTHQIRVHLSSIGHPILGDSNDESAQSKKLSQDFSVHGMCLHAWKLAFDSPVSGKQSVRSAVPPNFQKTLISTNLKLEANC